MNFEPSFYNNKPGSVSLHFSWWNFIDRRVQWLLNEVYTTPGKASCSYIPDLHHSSMVTEFNEVCTIPAGTLIRLPKACLRVSTHCGFVYNFRKNQLYTLVSSHFVNSHLVNFPLYQFPLCQFSFGQCWQSGNWQSGKLTKWGLIKYNLEKKM